MGTLRAWLFSLERGKSTAVSPKHPRPIGRCRRWTEYRLVGSNNLTIFRETSAYCTEPYGDAIVDMRSRRRRRTPMGLLRTCSSGIFRDGASPVDNSC